MRILLAVIVLVLGACGEVKGPKAAQGAACSAGTECESGSCSDGVCCDRACDAECEACTAGKTGGSDGVCGAVTANTDPDAECADEGVRTCGARGAGCNGSAAAPACNLYERGTPCGGTCINEMASVGVCDGDGTCSAPAPMPCGTYTCNAEGTACRTACTSTSECSATGFCNAAGQCGKRLRIAMETSATSCVRTEAFPPLMAALTARGHMVTIVTGDQIVTAGELAAYDVVLLGGPGAACTEPGWNTYAPALRVWVEAGGGFVATGWTPYMTTGTGLNLLPADIAAIIPIAGSSYLSGAQQVTAVGTHPIVNGLGTFTVSASFLPYGGTPKANTTQLLRDGANNNLGQAWDVGAGRVVYLGPLYVDSFASYANQSLTDGTNVPAREMLMRALEWSGKSL